MREIDNKATLSMNIHNLFLQELLTSEEVCFLNQLLHIGDKENMIMLKTILNNKIGFNEKERI